jgi:hypothetical protein
VFRGPLFIPGARLAILPNGLLVRIVPSSTIGGQPHFDAGSMP